VPGNRAPATYNALAMSSRATNKDAAYLFMQWATSRALDVGLVENGITSPRQSSWQRARNKPLETIPWAKTYFDALKVAKPAFPEISAVTELRDIVGIAIVQALQGGNVKEAAQNANAQLQTVLSATEK
jgi:multiple sugar transport system substrate-binding protein